MKIKIFILFIAGALLISAQTKRVHHYLNKTNSSTYHLYNTTTKENPCIRPHSRKKKTALNQPQVENPNVIKMDRLKNIGKDYVPVTFTHGLHAKMADMSGGCKMCHHYNPPGKVVSCSNCHELLRKRTDISKPDLKGAYHQLCMNCHRQWSRDVGCALCHNQKDNQAAKKVYSKIAAPVNVKFNTPNANGKIVVFNHSEHNKVFGLDCKQCHSDQSCVKCHAKEKVKAFKTNLTTQRHAKCQACHDTKRNCSMCHGSSNRLTKFDHFRRTGFDLERHHSKLSCNRCHTEKGKFTGLKKECKNCHGSFTKAKFNHKTTGLVLDDIHKDLECSDCHQEKNYAKPVCTNCHADKSFPKDVPGELIRKLPMNSKETILK